MALHGAGSRLVIAAPTWNRLPEQVSLLPALGNRGHDASTLLTFFSVAERYVAKSAVRTVEARDREVSRDARQLAPVGAWGSLLFASAFVCPASFRCCRSRNAAVSTPTPSE